MTRKEDPLDRLVIFLAKRDGIDKLVKTFQYVAKLAHWHLASHGQPSLADRAKKWEVSCGTSRKAFRTGRFLSGLNALRNLRTNPSVNSKKPNPNPSFGLQVLAVLANGGEMVYFFFDHLLWLARIGFLDTHLATRMSFVSAFGESFGYVFFIISDLIAITKGLRTERRLISATITSSSSSSKVSSLKATNPSLKVTDPSSSSSSSSSLLSSSSSSSSLRVPKDSDPLLRNDSDPGDGGHDDGEKAKYVALNAELGKIRSQRVMATLAIAANVADLIIGVAEIEPNPFCCHALTLGISGLVSAWSGWYRNWPSASK